MKFLQVSWQETALRIFSETADHHSYNSTHNLSKRINRDMVQTTEEPTEAAKIKFAAFGDVLFLDTSNFSLHGSVGSCAEIKPNWTEAK